MTSPWGTLQYIDKDVAPVLLRNRKFVVGRAADCDLSVSGKMVSGHHCYLEKQEDGQVYLWDTSSNGTLVNKLTRLTDKQKIEIKTGDEFYIAFNKDKQSLGFIFNNLTKPNEEKVNSLHTTEASTQLMTNSVEDNEDAEGLADPSIEVECKVEAVGKKQTETNDDECDEIEDHLTCSICQGILYKCISLQPCTHCFCAGCYSEWMTLSQECPQCRMTVDRIAPNYVVNNLIEAYLKQHPNKKRDEEDLRELDEKNKITQEMLFPKSMLTKTDKAAESFSDSDVDVGYPRWDRQSDGSDSDARVPPAVMFLPTLPRRQSFHKICRQCPDKSKKPPPKKRKKENYEADVQKDMPGCSSDRAEPSDQQAVFTCTRNTRHIQCLCCYEYMPDRSNERLQNPAIPPQKCALCPGETSYCHMYWGCKGYSCTGCLAPLENVTFDKNCLNYILNNGNAYESSLLVDYVKKKEMTWRNVLRDSLDKLEAGIYEIDMMKIRRGNFARNGPKIPVTRSTPVCKMCAYQCLAQLAYQYRRDIPVDDLPAEVTEREDCYWGRNCRTQVKIHHAKNFNHICEQTRMK